MNGVLVVDKPKGLTSNKVLSRIKKILNIKKAGHTGTLDPFATGVLPICFNEATKLIPYFDENYKEYKGVLHLGVETDTLDETGRVLNKNKVGKIEESDILECFYNFRGRVSQIPPMYSALKVKGVRMYDLARRGEVVERKPREIYIDKLELRSFKSPYLEFYVKCSKGTYIRSLGHDIGQILGCGAYLKELERISSGQFKIKDSYKLNDIEKSDYKVKSLNELLKHYESILIDDDLEKAIRTGKTLIKSYFKNCDMTNIKINERFVTLNNNNIVAILQSLKSNEDINECSDNEKIFKILRVINNI